MISKLAGPLGRQMGRVLMRGTSASHSNQILPVRYCSVKKVGDRSHWDPHAQGYKIPTVEKESPEKTLEYWRPLKKFFVHDWKPAELMPLAGLIALITCFPIAFFFLTRKDYETLPLAPDPKANKSPFKPRPDLINMADVIHNVSGCPGGVSGTPCPETCAVAPSESHIRRPCPPKIPKPCGNDGDAGSCSEGQSTLDEIRQIAKATVDRSEIQQLAHATGGQDGETLMAEAADDDDDDVEDDDDSDDLNDPMRQPIL